MNQRQQKVQELAQIILNTGRTTLTLCTNTSVATIAHLHISRNIFHLLRRFGPETLDRFLSLFKQIKSNYVDTGKVLRRPFIAVLLTNHNTLSDENYEWLEAVAFAVERASKNETVDELIDWATRQTKGKDARVFKEVV